MLWFMVCCIFVLCSSKFYPPLYLWEEVAFPPLPKSNYSQVSTFQSRKAERLTKGLPVYVSLTTISHRLEKACDVIASLLLSPDALIPTHVFLFVSLEPWLMDEGITQHTLLSNVRLLHLREQISRTFADENVFSVVYTNNFGPHRKLLPLLSKKWFENCIIITFDDESGRRHPHLEGPDKLLAQLLRYYKISDRSSIVALKVRRIGFCDVYPHFVLTYHPWWGQTTSGRHEMLVLPTGTGGVLYKPKFFHPSVFDPVLVNITRYLFHIQLLIMPSLTPTILIRLCSVGDDLAFRLATMMKGVKVVVGCHPLQQRYLGTGPCPRAKDSVLYSHGELDLPPRTNLSGTSQLNSVRTTSIFGAIPSTPLSSTLTSEFANVHRKGTNSMLSPPDEGAWKRRILHVQSSVGISTQDSEIGHRKNQINNSVTIGQTKIKAHQSLWASNRQGGNDKVSQSMLY